MGESAENLQREPIPVPEEVLVLDHDPIFIELLQNQLSAYGVPKIHTFSDGKTAWQTLTTDAKGIEFIILDWQLSGLSGVAMYNRVRQHDHLKNLPILIVSGTLEADDFQLLGESPLTHFLPKPFSAEKLQEKIQAMLLEKNWIQTNESTLQQALLELRPKETRKNIATIKDCLSSAPNPLPSAVVACRILRENEFYAEAEEIAREVILAYPTSSLLAINELGKALILQGRYQEAGEVLRHADHLSPQNIERLCLLGEISLNQAKPKAAREMFRRALEIDDELDKAKAGLHLAEVVDQNITEFRSTGNVITTNFASILNSIAITKIHAGQFSEGIHQYRSALTFLNTKVTVAKLTFNLGLAYLKAGDINQAYLWFVETLKMNPTMDKAKKYIARLRKSLEKNRDPASSQDSAQDQVVIEWE